MSRGPEANFWNTIRKNLPSKCKAWRVENRVTAGMPDVYAMYDGMPVWLELKTTKSNTVNLSPTQISWHTAHSHCNGLSFILVKHLGTGHLFLFQGHRARLLASEGLGSGFDFRGTRIGDLFGAIYDQSREHFGAILEQSGSGSG